jgi:glycosyltransferase involved in cell wall biosynthesis
VGSGPESERLRREAHGGVEFRGWVGEDELAAALASARALLFPGEEDFGIVPVEAQLCGAPVVAWAKGGALDTVTERTGVLYSGAAADAIRSFESRTFDPAEARRNALRFGREDHKRAIRACVERALEAHRAGRPC